METSWGKLSEVRIGDLDLTPLRHASGLEASSEPTVVRIDSTGHLHAFTFPSSFYLNRSWNSELWLLYSSTQAKVTGHVTKFRLGTKIYYKAYRLIYEYLSWQGCIIGPHDRSCKSNLRCFSTYRYSQIRGHSLDVDTLHSRWVSDSTWYLQCRLLTTHTSRGAHSTFLLSLKKEENSYCFHSTVFLKSSWKCVYHNRVCFTLALE